MADSAEAEEAVLASPVVYEEEACGICYYRLNDAVGLPCGHAACRGCIQVMIDHKNKKSKEEPLVRVAVPRCPVCSFDLGIQSADDLPPAFTVRALMTRIENMNKKCSSCNQIKAPRVDMFCGSCADNKINQTKALFFKFVQNLHKCDFCFKGSSFLLPRACNECKLKFDRQIAEHVASKLSFCHACGGKVSSNSVVLCCECARTNRQNLIQTKLCRACGSEAPEYNLDLCSKCYDEYRQFVKNRSQSSTKNAPHSMNWGDSDTKRNGGAWTAEDLMPYITNTEKVGGGRSKKPFLPDIGSDQPKQKKTKLGEKARKKAKRSSDEEDGGYGTVKMRVGSKEVLTLFSADIKSLFHDHAITDGILNWALKHYYHAMLNKSQRNMVCLIQPTLCHIIQHSDTDTFLSNLKNSRLYKKDLVLLPINDENNSGTADGGSHWSLLVYSRSLNSYTHMDSMGRNSSHAAVARAVSQRIEPLLDVTVSPSYDIRYKRVMQAPGYPDCGIFVVAFARMMFGTFDAGKQPKDSIFNINAESVQKLRKDLKNLVRSEMV